MNLSEFGARYSGRTGVIDLMEDLGRALTGGERLEMLGAGNPARIAQIEALWRRRFESIMSAPGALEEMLGNYDSPEGRPGFRRAVADALSAEVGVPIGPQNVCVTGGSQQAMFLLLNLFSGALPGSDRIGRILFPLLPEYIGYEDQPRLKAAVTACRPILSELGPHSFKYGIDHDALVATLEQARSGAADPIGAICVSRPTNPSGNVLTDAELADLSDLATRYDIPLIVDNAYGTPFPHIIFDDRLTGSARPIWNEQVILSMSLSKLGLPGPRTGIVVAAEPIIEALIRVNTILSLANNSVGQFIVEPLLADGTIVEVSHDVIGPYYRGRLEEAEAIAAEALGETVPWAMHRTEGAIFLWMRFPGLPISSFDLYQRLKLRNVIVVPGEYFFFGDPGREQWPHARECIRVNYGRAPEEVERGIAVIADEVRRAWHA